MAKEKFTFEAAVHALVHFLSVVLMLWLMIVPPLWVSLLVIVLEVAQMKYFGACFLTVFAHKRGYMKGKTYWQYVPWLLGVKNYKRADKFISAGIELLIIGILLMRTVLFFTQRV
jgi:hypothetical protein